MLRIEEIVGAMDDEFRHTLAEFDDGRLTALLADKTALRRIRPVGVSHREAVAMIEAIQAGRARRAAAEALRRRRGQQAGGVRVRRALLDLIGRMRNGAIPPPAVADPAPPQPPPTPPVLCLPAPAGPRLCLPAPDRRPATRPAAIRAPRPTPVERRRGLGPLLLAIAASLVAAILAD